MNENNNPGNTANNVDLDILAIKQLLVEVRQHGSGDSDDSGDDDPAQCCMMTFQDWRSAWQALGRIDKRLKDTETRNARQAEILQWANTTFGAATADNTGERIRRFAEEAAELAQAVGLDKRALLHIVDHVYAKPTGNVAQEIGQVGVSLLGLAEHLNLKADDEEREEFKRITSLPSEHWQARQNAKADKGLGLVSTAETKNNGST